MSDPAPTRQDVVEGHIAAVKEKYGVEAIDKLVACCVEDIAVSLAMLVDNGSSNQS